MKITTFAAAAALTGLSVAPALAQDMVTAKDPQSVIDALTAAGYQGATLSKTESGRSSIKVQLSGSPTYIDFYDCAADFTECYTMLFIYAMDLNDGTTLEKANEWNAQEITGRVSLDRDRDPALDYAFSTFEGVSQSVFEQNVELWDKKVGQVKDFFDF
ncbi:MAG: YbjN domain-containing protein [Devosia sp.]